MGNGRVGARHELWEDCGKDPGQDVDFHERTPVEKGTKSAIGKIERKHALGLKDGKLASFRKSCSIRARTGENKPPP